MRFVFVIFVFLFSFNGYGQKLGYREFVIDSTLSNELSTRYHISTDTSAQNTFIINGNDKQLEFCRLPVDTLWIQMDSSKTITAITIQTKYLERPDYRAFNFEWSKLLQCIANNFGSLYKTGEIKFENILISLWFIQQHVWLYATMKKVFPWQKQQKRCIVIRWEKHLTPFTIIQQ